MKSLSERAQVVFERKSVFILFSSSSLFQKQKKKLVTTLNESALPVLKVLSSLSRMTDSPCGTEEIQFLLSSFSFHNSINSSNFILINIEKLPNQLQQLNMFCTVGILSKSVPEGPILSQDILVVSVYINDTLLILFYTYCIMLYSEGIVIYHD